MTMRILHVHPGNMLGGIERVLVNVARDHRPDIENQFALLSGDLNNEIVRYSPVHNLPDVRLRNPLSVFRARRVLAGILRSNEFSIVLTHAVWTQALFGPTIARSRIPSVFWLRGRVTGNNWIEKLARRWRPERALCNSEFTSGTLDILYPDIERTVIYNPLPAVPAKKTRSEVRKELGATDGELVVTIVSRMEPGKGHRDLIEALSRLNDRSTTCWIVGGPQRQSEEELVRELRSAVESTGMADRVRFLGMRNDVADIYGASDIFCQPNILPEGFGNTFIEALHAGLPVVTTAMGGAMEIVTSECGILVEPGNVDALVAALKRLTTDADLRQRLGRNGPARAKLLCEPDQQFTKLYRELQNFLDSR